MKTVVIEIKKENRKTAWGEHLLDLGYERDQFEDKYRKKIVTWLQNGIEYTASTKSNELGDLIITLTEYK